MQGAVSWTIIGWMPTQMQEQFKLGQGHTLGAPGGLGPLGLQRGDQLLAGEPLGLGELILGHGRVDGLLDGDQGAVEHLAAALPQAQDEREL